MVNVKIDTDGVQLNRTITRYVDRISDFRPIWDDVAKAYFKVQEAQFDTEGHGQWVPLSSKYASWKQSNAPGQGLLVLSGDLRKAATGKSGAVVQKSEHQLAIGFQRAGYWRYHQTGTSRMPQRRIVEIREEDRRIIMRQALRALIKAVQH